MDSAELNQNSYNRSFFDRLSLQSQNGNKRRPFTVTKQNTVHSGVFKDQPKFYDWITSTDMQSQVVKMTKNILSIKIAGQYLIKFARTKMMN